MDDRNWPVSRVLVTIPSILGTGGRESARTGRDNAIFPKARAMNPGMICDLATDKVTEQAARLISGMRGPRYVYV
jgi:hypothetical protein